MQPLGKQAVRARGRHARSAIYVIKLANYTARRSDETRSDNQNIRKRTPAGDRQRVRRSVICCKRTLPAVADRKRLVELALSKGHAYTMITLYDRTGGN